MKHSWNDWRPQDPVLASGFDLWRGGNLLDALLFFQHYLDRHPDDAGALRGYGSVLWTLRLFQEALHFFQLAVRVDCWNPMQWSNLGLVYRDLKQRSRAIRTFEVAVALDPEYEPAYNEWANVLYDAARFGDALVLYDKALSLDNSRAVVHHNRGMCLKVMRDKVSAIAAFETALAIDPSYPHSLMELKQLFGTVRCGPVSNAM